MGKVIKELRGPHHKVEEVPQERHHRDRKDQQVHHHKDRKVTKDHKVIKEGLVIPIKVLKDQ